MNRITLVTSNLLLPLTSAALLLAGCTDANPAGLGPDEAPASRSATEAHAARPAPATGSFTTTLTGPPTAEPVGANCRLTAPLQLDLTGDLAGAATGEITVLIFASCADAGTNPSGTFPDRFRATTTFEGTAFGEAVSAPLTYVGRTAAGGAVRGRFLLQGGARGALEVEATAGVGGSYRGRLVTRP